MKLFRKNESYKEDINQEYSYGINYIDLGEEKQKKTLSIINIIFIVVLALMIMITADVVAITKYQAGPFFAIRTKVYKDGGTSQYYGLGYKVIKYNQEKGRKDKVIGPWSMSYVAKPTKVATIDLALELRNEQKTALQKYYGEYLELTGTISKLGKNKITVTYKDPKKEYTLEVIGNISTEVEDMSQYKVGDEIIILGTIASYELKTDSTPIRVYMNNCFPKSV